MPVSFDALRRGEEPAGRVTFEARFIRELPCGRCPPRAKCEPCSTRLLFEETPGEPETQFGVFGSGLRRDTVYRLYLLLSPGYEQALGKTPLADPRRRLVTVEGMDPLP